LRLMTISRGRWSRADRRRTCLVLALPTNDS